MQLHRMDDVAGCRLIFPTVDKLFEFRQHFHKARFNHRLRNDPEKYNYIASPNSDTGYRGVHDIYEYDVRSETGKPNRGLLIEIQYRTRYQHAWATCVELIGFITENQPKFRTGDKRYQDIMQLASEIIARAFEDSKSSLPDLSDAEVVEKFLALDEELKLLELLRGLNSSGRQITDNKNMILIYSNDLSLEVRSFRDATDAIKALFKLEKENTGKDIVLVRADSTEDVRNAFRNYFSDAQEFLQLIEDGCQRLLPGKVSSVRRPGRRR